jgi:hypothetical protein
VEAFLQDLVSSDVSRSTGICVSGDILDTNAMQHRSKYSVDTEEATGCWELSRNGNPHNLYCSIDIVGG